MNSKYQTKTVQFDGLAHFQKGWENQECQKSCDEMKNKQIKMATNAYVKINPLPH